MANINKTARSNGIHNDRARPIPYVASDLQFPPHFESVSVVRGYVNGRIGYLLDPKTPFHMNGLESAATNKDCAAVTVRTVREGAAKAFNGPSSAGLVPADLGGWMFSRDVVNTGLRTRFQLFNQNTPVTVTFDVPDIRKAAPDVDGENFVAAAHLDLPAWLTRDGRFPESIAAVAVRNGFKAVADDASLSEMRRPYKGCARMTREWTAFKPSNVRGLVAHTLAMIQDPDLKTFLRQAA